MGGDATVVAAAPAAAASAPPAPSGAQAPVAPAVSNGVSPNPALQKMFRGDNSTLSLCYVKDRRALEGLSDFLEKGSVRIVNLVEPAHVSILTHVLQEVARVRNKIEVLHLDLWSNGAPELIDLLGKAFDANRESLLEVSLKCRVGSKFIADLLPLLPSNIEILDLSENLLSDTVFLQPLMDFVKCSELHLLRLSNCSIRAGVLAELVSKLISNLAPISLDALEGVDFSECEEIPKAVRTTLREPPAKTRKDHMGYSDVGVPPHRDAGVQFLDYLKSALLMQRLVGCRVRVWWPATSDENRSAFAGRFWPANVLRVNSIDMIFVVEYDNQEVDRVPCKFIQPESAFLYGGGMNANFLCSLFGTSYYRSLSSELSSHPRELQIVGSSSMPSEPDPITSMIHSGVDPLTSLCTPGDKSGSCGVLSTTDASSSSYFRGNSSSSSWPPMQVGTNGVSPMCTVRSQVGEKRVPSGPSSSSDRLASNGSVKAGASSDGQSSSELASTPSADRVCSSDVPESNGRETPVGPSHRPASLHRGPTVGKKGTSQHDMSGSLTKSHKFISRMLEDLTLASNRRSCEVYFPKDLSHLAHDCAVNVETLAGLDSSLSGNVLQPGDVCEFRDPLDYDGSDPSDYIGVIKEVNEKEPLYKVICVYQDDEEVVEMDSHDVRRLSLLPWYLWVALVMAVERHALLSKRLSECRVLQSTLADCLLCPKKRDPSRPFKGTPPNPMEMQLHTLSECASEVGKFPPTHPRAVVVPVNRAGEGDSAELLRYQLRKQQQKLDALLELYEAARLELEKERDLNVELQAKLNCVVCFEKRINCLLNPCGHFNFCSVCAESFASCPICRRKIVRRQVLSVD